MFLFFIFGCAKKDLDLPEVSSSTISGKLSGFSSSSSLGLSESANNSAQAAGVNLSQSLVTAMSCSSATASLYRLDSRGTRVEPALATCALGSDGSYSFNSKSIGVSFSSSTPSETLIVSISGCTSGVYSRPITGAKDQYVTMGSTVLSYLLNTDNKSKVYSALKNSPANFSSLIATLDSATTLADAYSLLSSNSAITSRFTNLFGVAPTALDQASPEVVSNTLPSAASELVSAHLAVSVSHFSSSYNVVYSWKLDGTVIGTQADWQWTPTGNMQGTHTLSLAIGEDDGSGNVDTAKPVKTLSQALTITNNVLPTAPSFSITTPSVVGTTPINTRALTLTINTGGSKANCASFSNLALTENDSAAPAASAFTISCTQDGTQTLSYTLASSGDGLKTLRLWAIDASGAISSVASSTFVYLDTGSPTMTIATTPSALSSNASQTFSFAATDNGGVIDHYECKMDGGSYAACSTPKSYSSLSEADHTFYVKAFDTAGNASNVDSKTWHIDLTAPTLSVSGSPNAITNQLTATFSFSASDSGGGTVASLSCNLDSAGYASCASPFINVLSAGAHTLLIKATDTAGNISAVQSFSWTIDTSLPTVTIASKPASLTNSTSASFTFSGTDTGGGSVASYECNLDSAGYSACTSVKTYTGLSAAAHTIAIRAIDTAGNIGSATSYNWTIDLTTPLASINSGPNSLTNSTSASFTFSANPPPAGSITGYECDIDSAGFASCSSPKSYASLTQGSHTFQVRSIDNNGNRSSAVSQSWTVDTTAPTLTINSNPTSLNNSTSASFTFSATDSGGGTVASYACKIDAGSYASCSSPISYSSLEQGSHTFYVTATDSAGNTNSATTNTWTTDLTAPAITISANPTSVTNSSSANFTFSATDSGGGTVSSYQCSIDGAAYATCTSIKSYTGLTAGSHQFALLAIDTAGNTSSASTYSWTIDTTAPTISITSTPNSPTNATTASFSFSATDSGGGGAIASYACKIDAGSYASCTSPTSYSSLAAGAHTFYITSTDTAGNTSSASSVSWTIDLTAPTVAITTPAASAVVLASNIASYAMSGTCSENGQTVTIAGSVSTTATCASGAWSATVDLSGLADGTLSITAAQSDVAGNTTTTASRSFIKDTTAPTISVTTPSAMQGNVSTGSVTWTLTETNVAASTNFTVEVYNGTSWSSVGTKAATAGANSSTAYTFSSFAVPNVDVTTARIRVTLSDAAGNSTTSQTNTFTIDSTAPTNSGFQLANGATNVANPSVVYTITSTDSSGLGGIRFSETATYANTNWLTYAASGSYSISAISGAKTIYVWTKDTVGNVSSSSSYNISLDFGSPPTALITAPTTGATYSSGQTVHIEWSCSSSNGLDSLPARVSYSSDDGTTYNTLSSWVTNNLTSTTGSYDWTFPVSVSSFRLMIECKSAAGVVSSAYSQVLNTTGWSVFAGDPAAMSENVNANVALLSYSGNTNWQSSAVDTQGNIFFAKGPSIMKIDAQSGQVTRLAGTPTNTAGSCNMTAGQDPLTSSYNLISNNPLILGMNAAKTELLVRACSYIWSMNTSTRALTVVVANSGLTQWYFSRAGYLYYAASNSQIYRMNLYAASPTAQLVYGNGTCGTMGAVGTAGDQSPAMMTNTSICGSETYIISNADDSSLWIGCWSGVSSCPNAARLDWDNATQKYLIASTDVGWTFANSGRGFCIQSEKTTRAWCSGRYNNTNIQIFDYSTNTWTATAFSTNSVFIRYAPSPTGMIGLASDNILRSYTENSDGTITTVQIGGSNIDNFGNGTDLSKVAFSSTYDLTYSSTLGALFVSTSGLVRKIIVGSTNISTLQTTSAIYLSGGGSSPGTFVINKAGDKFIGVYNCSGQLYQVDYVSSNTIYIQSPSYMRRNTCGAAVYDATYPVTDGTTTATRVDWKIDTNRRPLMHTNGKMYFFVKNAAATGDGFIYSSDGTTLKIVAGKTGTSGYSASDNGAVANGALLNNVRYIYEFPSGPHAGDLLIVDSNRLRMITIVSESSSPKIYDLVSLTLAGTYTNNSSDSFTDAVYDFSSETLDGSSNPIPGSGALYYAYSLQVHKWIATGFSGSTITSATDSTYSFSGTTLSGNIRLSINPAGLLVTQPTKFRILRVAP